MNILIPKAFRYIISGGTGAIVSIATLFVMTHFLGVWYLASSIAAFILSFFVSFYLQRTWTFERKQRNTLTRHMVLFLGIALLNLALNTCIVYIAVEYIGLWYVLAQIIAGIIVATSTFFVYQHFIFNDPEEVHA